MLNDSVLDVDRLFRIPRKGSDQARVELAPLVTEIKIFFFSSASEEDQSVCEGHSLHVI